MCNIKLTCNVSKQTKSAYLSSDFDFQRRLPMSGDGHRSIMTDDECPVKGLLLGDLLLGERREVELMVDIPFSIVAVCTDTVIQNTSFKLSPPIIL
ncbi:hypothetical protein CEXT_309021 [Caerostris extrusa]|uniref:Uncharacterized protein n=1 Tax=Caerostris extrusa TaxID=172846 RepID=A0AAV4XW54_CAEEX|nr:hypothetical protein CEXT_309021 [Caerostris extrusa]